MTLVVGSLPALAEDEEESAAPPQVIDPQVDRREIKPARIDTEDFELGGYVGLMSIEDFGTNTVVGARLAYHITEGLFFEGTYGQTTAKETSFEVLSGAAMLLTDDQRDLTYYNLALGYSFLPGETFIGRRHAFDTAIYVVAGAGATEFAGDDRFTVSFGAGVRFLPTDWLALHVDARDHMFDIDLLGEEKTTHNIEFTVGITAFF